MGGYWSDYDKVAKATRKIGRGYNEWVTDYGMTIHATRHGVTACGVAVGVFSAGWLGGTWLHHEGVTCKRCLRTIGRDT